MNLKILRESGEYARFDEIFKIGREFELDGKKAVVLALTRKGTEISLWILGQKRKSEDDKEQLKRIQKKRQQKTLTKKEELTEHFLMSAESGTEFLHAIRELFLQGKPYKLGSSTSGGLTESDPMQLLTLWNLLEAGTMIGELEETDWNELVLVQLNFQKELKRLPLKKTQEFSMKFLLGGIQRRELFSKKMTLPINQSLNRAVQLTDPKTGEKICCYISRIELYDPCSKEELARFEDPTYQKKALKHITPEQLQEMKQQYYESIRLICPDGMCLPVIEYESEKWQFEFHNSEYLKEKINPSVQGASSVFFLMHPEQSQGCHGWPMHCGVSEAVSKETKELSIELFLGFQNLPDRDLQI